MQKLVAVIIALAVSCSPLPAHSWDTKSDAVANFMFCMEGEFLTAAKATTPESRLRYLNNVESARELENKIWDISLKTCEPDFRKIEKVAFGLYRNDDLKDAYLFAVIDATRTFEFIYIRGIMRGFAGPDGTD